MLLLFSVSLGSQNLEPNFDPLTREDRRPGIATADDSERHVAVQCPDITSSDLVRRVDHRATRAAGKSSEEHALRHPGEYDLRHRGEFALMLPSSTHPGSFRHIVDRELEIRLLRTQAMRSTAFVRQAALAGISQAAIHRDVERMYDVDCRVRRRTPDDDSDSERERQYRSTFYMRALDPSRLRRRGFAAALAANSHRGQCDCSNIRGIPDVAHT